MLLLSSAFAAPPFVDTSKDGGVGPQAVDLTRAARQTAPLLYDNGPLENQTGLSVVQENLGLTTHGFEAGQTSNRRLADDFTVTHQSWSIEEIVLYCYNINASTPNIDRAYIAIFDGPPNDPGSNLVRGDLTTPFYGDVSWAGFYRVRSSNTSDTSRAVQHLVVTLDTPWNLSFGEYWLVFSFGGGSGLYVPPVTRNGQTTTGNALGFDSGWVHVQDEGANTNQGLPFALHGQASGPLVIPALDKYGIAVLGGLLVLTLVYLRRRRA